MERRNPPHSLQTFLNPCRMAFCPKRSAMPAAERFGGCGKSSRATPAEPRLPTTSIRPSGHQKPCGRPLMKSRRDYYASLSERDTAVGTPSPRNHYTTAGLSPRYFSSRSSGTPRHTALFSRHARYRSRFSQMTRHVYAAFPLYCALKHTKEEECVNT